MVNSQTLDVVIGLAVMFLSVSMVCASINELLAAILELRENRLTDALHSLLGSKLADDVLAHPVVPSAPGKSPAYIEPALFTTALLDTLTGGSAPTDDADAAFGELKDAVTKALGGADPKKPEGKALKSLNALMSSAEGDFKTFHDRVGQWFDSYMDRVGGAYKRATSTISLIVAICVVSILNVDTFDVYRELSTQPLVAAAVAARSPGYIKAGAPADQAPQNVGQAFDAVASSIQGVALPIGWGRAFANGKPVEPWFEKIIGLLITAIAAALGAPFWFDVLGKLANLRAAGPKPDGSSPTQSSAAS